MKLEGDPDNPRNHGHLCAKGLSGFLSVYSPSRLRRPLIRTNPEKGLGNDPRWREISWEEAIGSVADKLRKILDDPRGYDGRRIMFDTFDHMAMYGGIQQAWAKALQAYQSVISAACFCGNSVHPPSYLNTSTFEITADAEYCRYLLLIGSQAGSIIHYDTMNTARHIAEKRPGEVKVVVVDPMCGYAASKSEEWVPIRPGTDTAFILAVVNLLINDYSIYDADFLKRKTNAPYLIGKDGKYVRDKISGKPLVWDSRAGTARPFDEGVEDCSLEGEYTVDDESCKPGFQLLKEHVRSYTPGSVSEITTVPADTIRRIAKELGEAASVGSTIMIDGVELPYRPVSVVWYRGLSAHSHSFLSGLAAILLPTILGAVQVPGGIQGHPPAKEYVTDEGLMASFGPGDSRQGMPYPPREVKRPSSINLIELFPVSYGSHPLSIAGLLHPEKFNLKAEELVRPEILFIYRDNIVKNTFTPEIVVAALKKIPFIVALSVEPDETMQVADLVFPDLHHLERLSENVYARVGEPGFWYGAKPAVHPPFDAPRDRMLNNSQLFLEIAEKAGFLDRVYEALNGMWGLHGTPYELDPRGRYGHSEIIDRRLKSWLGAEKGLEWFLSDPGGLLVWAASPQERYRGPARKGRLHVYYEFMVKAGEDVKRVVTEMGLRWRTSDYQALPDWKPCQSFTNRTEEYDLFVINYKVPIQAHGVGRFSPILRQLNDQHGLDAALINVETAKRKEIREGDEVWIETNKGRRVKAVLRLSERIHPEVVATSQHRLSKGADFNALVTQEEDTLDFTGCAIDSCLLARVVRA